MPLVRIDALGAGPERLEALGRAVHDALTETIGFPPDDLFQILTGHDGRGSLLRYGGYPGIARDDGLVGERPHRGRERLARRRATVRRAEALSP